MNWNKTIKTILAVCVVSVGLSACRTPKDVAYFQDADTTAIIEMAKAKQITLRPGDKLTIVVKSKDAAISDLFNMPVYTNRVGRGVSGESLAPYTVNDKGDIDFPVLGSLHVEGMTRGEVAGFVKGELMGRNLVKDPTVAVEFLNVGVNILGDVNGPGRYEMNRDDLSVLEAISMAGDLKITGKRDNVKVIREENGKLHTYTLDLTNIESVGKSPAYYLQNGDIVYVEPNDMQKRNSSLNGNNALSTGFWISVASLITSAITTVGVFVRK
ncbi:MAG: polysaccharide biosynthesis/export family protein [Muribaculaceae bacterium]|nr:polysaccharide biosynthesis/export family protein [Muribaculaceae bacterium]MDE6866595.1 polysaccharide biosynthesis/export family protein [Muribaculaceae bacterium]